MVCIVRRLRDCIWFLPGSFVALERGAIYFGYGIYWGVDKVRKRTL